MFAGKILFFNFSLDLSVLEPKKNLYNIKNHILLLAWHFNFYSVGCLYISLMIKTKLCEKYFIKM